MAEATARMVTAPRPRESARLMAALAISAALCSGTGPRAERGGRVQMLPLAAVAGSFVIANTVLSNLCCINSEQRSQF